MSATTVDRSAEPTRDEGAATRAFSVSMLISATRCVLTYVVFPWVLPAAGVAGGVGPGVGLVVGVVALASNGLSIRRFWAADHRWKWPITAINVGVIALVSTFVVGDVAALL
jgi:hypothetical protein